ncbi:MAG TPA: SRPBCC family protein [Tepidisphaeraceae bacterium]|nr:SRPBCC family protein [Tepidisphaeraceae bacterium]
MTDPVNFPESGQPPRCLDCGYILLGLSAGNCPECGKFFDPAHPATWTTKPLFVRWKFWLPGFLLACGGGTLLYVFLIWVAGWGLAVTLVAPFAIGTVVGYGTTVRPFVLVLLAIGATIIIIFTLVGMGLAGTFCGLVLASITLGPMLVGAASGALLRVALKQTRFQQRGYLPILILAICVGLLGLLERAIHTPYAIERVVTSVEIPAPIGRTWNAVMLYEQVHHRPPWLLRFGLPRPLYTRGSMEHVGDVKVCVYTKGRLVKRITGRVPERRLAFDVIGQINIENHDVRLVDGSFDFAPDGPTQTRITLTTRYEPKLGPRWVWRPAERLAVHALHKHVLEGMRQKATEP